MKIVSLVPSVTATLFDFGLNENQIVGRTKFCIHPENSVQKIPIIGGTKNINTEKILSLKPDLIIASKEENVREQIEILMNETEVWVTDIQNLEDNSKFLLQLGEILNKEKTAKDFCEKIKANFNFNKNQNHKRFAYLIWQNPMMTVGCDTFIHSVMAACGFENLFKTEKRYPQISDEKLQEADVIFLSSEPFPFGEKHLEDFAKRFPNAEVKLVSGEAFSWFGSYLAKCGDYYEKLYEELFSLEK